MTTFHLVRLWRLGVSLSLAALLGGSTTCAPDAVTTTAGSPSVVAADVPVQTQEQIMGRLAKGLARALADPAIRGGVYYSLLESPFPERKLHFRSFLAGSGRPLLDAMISNGDARSASEVFASLDSVIDLEFYMPVESHRAIWSGGSDLIVATARKDHEIPVAFDINGNSVAIMSAEVPPTVPTLALVPAETDFSVTPATNSSVGASMSSAITECPPNACMTYSYVPGDWEGFMMGSPEFEVHVFVRDTTESVALRYRCAGAQGTPFYYDQNHIYWSGSVELVAATHMDAFRDQGKGLLLQVWEDDADDCAIAKDADWLEAAYWTVAALFSGFEAVQILENGWDTECTAYSTDNAICWLSVLTLAIAPLRDNLRFA